MFQSFNLQVRMGVLLSRLTFLAKIKIRAVLTLVSDSLNVLLLTEVTIYTLVNYFRFLFNYLFIL